MQRKERAIISILVIILLVGQGVGAVQQTKPKQIKLSPPNTVGGKPLMQALKNRQSTKTFTSQNLSLSVMSDLLWAAFGINRPETGKRTAPSAMNSQEMDIYVVFQDGTYLYEADGHRLVMVSERDVRSLAATQSYARVAPINLIYIADYARMNARIKDEKKSIYAAFHAGAIAQNVHLYCASAGLGAVVRDGVNRKALHKALNLRPEQAIVMAQTVGYAEKK